MKSIESSGFSIFFFSFLFLSLNPVAEKAEWVTMVANLSSSRENADAATVYISSRWRRRWTSQRRVILIDLRAHTKRGVTSRRIRNQRLERERIKEGRFAIGGKKEGG